MRRLFPALLVASALLFSAPPVAERINQVDVYHGVKVADPYRWLENLDSPKTQAWIKAERAYTGSWFSAAPGRAQAIERMKRLWNFDRTPLYQKDGSLAGIVVRGRRIFFLRQMGSENQPVLYVRDTPESQPRVLLNVNALAVESLFITSTAVAALPAL